MTNESPDEGDIYYNLSVPYEDVRLLHHCVLETIKNWPGSPARHPTEQEHLWYLRDELYRAILDYRFTYLDSDDKQ